MKFFHDLQACISFHNLHIFYLGYCDDSTSKTLELVSDHYACYYNYTLINKIPFAFIQLCRLIVKMGNSCCSSLGFFNASWVSCCCFYYLEMAASFFSSQNDAELVESYQYTYYILIYKKVYCFSAYLSAAAPTEHSGYVVTTISL